MSLFQTVQNDVKESLKKKEPLTTSTLRMLLSALQYAGMNKKEEAPYSDELVLSVIKNQVKQRKDAIEAYTKGGRIDLKEKEESELSILERYLPKQLSDDELRAIVTSSCAEAGATSKKDMGTVIKLVMEKTAGGADGKRISMFVSQCLPA